MKSPVKVGKIGNRCSDARSFFSFFFFLSFSLFLSRFLLFILLSNFFLENRIFVVIENQTIEKVMELLQMLNEHAVRTRITRTRCSTIPPGHRSRYRDRTDLKFA